MECLQDCENVKSEFVVRAGECQSQSTQSMSMTHADFISLRICCIIPTFLFKYDNCKKNVQFLYWKGCEIICNKSDWEQNG